MADLTRKRERAKLAVRREPYWQRLGVGAFLGFRRGPDTWVARFRSRDGKQQYNALAGQLEYDDAKKAAEQWLTQLEGSPVRVVKRGTVREALEGYLADLRRHGRDSAAKEIEARFRLTVWSDPLAGAVLERASREDFEEWRDRLRAGRLARSVNRQVRAVIAGLNAAHALGFVSNVQSWRLKPLSDDRDDDGDVAVFLSPEQRRALIAAASPHAADFFKGLELTGARPSELAATTVADFDGERLKLQHRKGRPAKLRTRYAVLGDDGVEFFKTMTRRKLPAAPIFTEDGEQPWRRHVWAREMRAAITKHNEHAKGRARVPIEASAYSFRHARISELLQVHGIDPLTVAAQTGTSLQMIERNYHKFIESAMRDKLRQARAS